MSLLIALAFLLLFASPAQAFLAVSSLSIISSSLLPYLIALVLLFLLSFVAFFRRFKKISLLLSLLLLIGGAFFAKKLVTLKKVNNLLTVKKEQVNPDQLWNFKNNFYYDPEDGLIHDQYWPEFKTAFADVDKKEVTSIWEGLYDDHGYEILLIYKASPEELKDLSQFDYVIGYDLTHDFIQVKGNEKINNDIFFEIADALVTVEPQQLADKIESLGFTKKDKILFFCPGGYTSNYLSYIFNNAGFQAKVISLEHIILSKDQEILDEWFFIDQQAKAKDIILEPIKETNLLNLKNNQNHLLFLLEINNLYRDLCYFEDSTLKKIVAIKTSNYQIKEEFRCHDNKIHPGQHLLSRDFTVLNENKVEALLKNGHQVVCTGSWHCFLTKHYLHLHNWDHLVDKMYFLERY